MLWKTQKKITILNFPRMGICSSCMGIKLAKKYNLSLLFSTLGHPVIIFDSPSLSLVGKVQFASDPLIFNLTFDFYLNLKIDSIVYCVAPL